MQKNLVRGFLNRDSAKDGMRSYHRLVSLFGVEVGLHISWYAVFALLSYALATGLFPQILPGKSNLAYAVMGIISSLLLFLSVLLHELAHCLAAQNFRLNIKRIILFFFGGISQIDEDGLTPQAEIWMALAGPVFSLALGAVCWIWSSNLELTAVSAVVRYVARLNVTLGFFNLIPGFPLDGGRVFRGLLWLHTGRLDVSTWYATRSGKLFGLLMVILGLLSLGFGDAGGGWLILIGGFLFLIAESSFEQMILKQSLSGKTVAEVVDRDPIAISPSASMDRLVKDYFTRLPQEHLPVFEGKKFVGVVNLGRVVRIHPQARTRMYVKDVMVSAGAIPSVSLGDSLYAALERMNRSRVDILPVFKGKKVEGIVTREAVFHFLRVRALRVKRE